MNQPDRSRVFFLALCLAFVLGILGTIDLHAASGRQHSGKQHLGMRDRAVPVSNVDPAVQRLSALTHGDARIGLDRARGLATFVGFGPEGFLLETPESRKRTAEDRALEFLRDFGAAFGITDADAELELAESLDAGTGTQLRFIQLHRGLRVVGGELRVYFDADGNLTAFDSRFEAGLDVSPESALNRTAVEAMATQSPDDLTTGPLVVYRTGDGAGDLAYESESTLGSADAQPFFLLDGRDGHAVPDTASDPTPGTKIETHTLTVGADERTVHLTHNYASPVVVCSAGHANNVAPAVARVTQVMAASFDIRLQNPGDLAVVHEETVHCIVAEEGRHTVDGHKFEAQKYTTSVTDYKGRWTGTPQTYLHEYDQPVVIGQVIGTDGEQTAWSVFWNKGQSRGAPPSAAALTTGRTVMEDTNSGRGLEAVGFIVFESGHGIFAGVEFEAGVGARTVSGAPNGAPFAYRFSTPFAAPPAVPLNQMAGVVGGDGGWSQTFGDEPTTVSTLNLFIDEDQISDAERSHDEESVGYAVFARDFAYPQTQRGPSPVPCDGGDCGEEEVGLQMETFTVHSVTGNFRSIPTLTHNYASPVVVCNVRYVNNTLPVVTRINNLNSRGFDIKLQNPSGGPVVADDVYCIVVEEGTWERDGVRFEAQKFQAPVTDRNTRWIGQSQTYNHAYTAPVVVGQVMSFEDSGYSVYWQRGEARNMPPSATALTNGMTVLQDHDITRNREVIGFIVFESGHGPFLGTTYEAITGADLIRGVHNATPFSYAFQQPFDRTPRFAVTSMAGANGGDGGWSQLHGGDALTADALSLSIDEDQISDFERSHTQEQVSYLVFERDVVFPELELPPRGPRIGPESPEPCVGICGLAAR